MTSPAQSHTTLRWAAAGLALGIAALAWWLIYARPDVITTLPRRGDAAEVVYATGTIEPRDWAKVVAMQRRRIVDACACEGQPVKKGDVLARLDDVEERAVLAELEARRATINADVQRLARLLARNVTTQVAYDEKVTQLREIDARIAAQKDRLDDLDLKAPMDGVVLRKDATVGEIAGTGLNDVLFWVGNPKPLEVDAEVNEEDIAKVTVGQSVLLRHDGFPGATLPARVGHITPKGDPGTKTFSVTLELPDDTPLKIGMSVEANIIVREAKNVLLVPADALAGDHVQSVAGGRIKRLPVKAGIRGSQAVEIVSGLDEGTPILSPALPTLPDGTRVRARAQTTK